LGVNAVIKEDLSDRAEMDRFQQVLKRYVDIDDSRAADRHTPRSWDRFGFAFSHPSTYTPITGTIETISSTGLSFIPESPALVADLEINDMLEDASLRVGDEILSMRCRVVRSGPVMAFSFEGEESVIEKIDDYLNSRADREMKALLKQ
ncbi:MAG: PilZ domain-containing protein, partial [Spirochaetales bacterium]|nr:PilZ domain-containing protein [Spirochaetales bacterium]